MNIQPNAAAASAAGTAHAASKGGETDKQSAEAANRQSVRETPAGQRPEAGAVEQSEQSGDRGGDGREFYDTFERADEQQREDTEQHNGDPEEGDPEEDRGESEEADQAAPRPDHGGHLDLEA